MVVLPLSEDLGTEKGKNQISYLKRPAVIFNPQSSREFPDILISSDPFNYLHEQHTTTWATLILT